MGDSRKAKGNLRWTEMRSEVSASGIEKPSAEWKTIAQIAKETHRSIPYVTYLMRQARSDETVEVKKFKIQTGGRLYPVPHYKMK